MSPRTRRKRNGNRQTNDVRNANGVRNTTAVRNANYVPKPNVAAPTEREDRHDLLDRHDPQGKDAAGMESELTVLRQLLRQALEQAGECADAERADELKHLIANLDSLSRTAARLGRIEQMQRAGDGGSRPSPELMDALKRNMAGLRAQEGGGDGSQ